MEEKKEMMDELKEDNLSRQNGDQKSGETGTLSGLGELTEEMSAYVKGVESQRERQNIYDILEEDIMSSDISDAEKARRLSNLVKIRGQKVNIMLAGARVQRSMLCLIWMLQRWE